MREDTKYALVGIVVLFGIGGTMVSYDPPIQNKTVPAYNSLAASSKTESQAVAEVMAKCVEDLTSGGPAMAYVLKNMVKSDPKTYCKNVITQTLEMKKLADEFEQFKQK